MYCSIRKEKRNREELPTKRQGLQPFLTTFAQQLSKMFIRGLQNMQCTGHKKQFSLCFDELFSLFLPPVNAAISLKDLLCSTLL